MSNSIRLQIAREKVTRIIERGASSGIYSHPIIPKALKKSAYKFYLRISQQLEKTWTEQLFALLWAGKPEEFGSSLLVELKTAPPTPATIDAVARMAWYAASNYDLEISDELDEAFTTWATLNVRPASGSFAQWKLARHIHGNDSQVSLDDEGAAIYAEMIIGRTTLSDSTPHCIAAIRTAKPEEWIRGHETEPRRELQSELSLWLAWLWLSQDLEPFRFARHNMLKTKRRDSYIVIDEATPSTSNIALMIHGFDMPEKKIGTGGEKSRGLYLLHNSLPWDSQGYATRSHGLLTGINSRGWKVDALTRIGYPFDRHTSVKPADGTESQVIDGVTYRRLGILKTNHINTVTTFVNYYAERAIKVAREVNPEIVHAASNFWNGLAAALVSRELGIPYIYEVRGLWEVTGRSNNPGYQFTMRYRMAVRFETLAAKSADHVFTLTNALRNELVSRGVDPEKISLLPNCVDADRFTPRERDTELEAQLGFKDKVVIGYVGSILDYEGLDHLIRAANIMRKVRDDFRVLIVGSGAAADTIRDLTTSLGLNDIVTFTGRVPHADVERYYSLVDIAPFPRLPLPVCEMVSPLKPFEAMAMKKVCIVSSVEAMAEFIDPGVTGLIFDKGSDESLVEKLTELLDSPELRKQIGENSREWVLSERTWEQAADRVHAVYSALTNK